MRSSKCGTRPHLAPGAAGDEILPFGGEGGLAGIGPIDPGVAQDLAARIRAALVAFLVVHCFAPRQNNDGPRGRSLVSTSVVRVSDLD